MIFILSLFILFLNASDYKQDKLIIMDCVCEEVVDGIVVNETTNLKGWAQIQQNRVIGTYKPKNLSELENCSEAIENDPVGACPRAFYRTIYKCQGQVQAHSCMAVVATI